MTQLCRAQVKSRSVRVLRTNGNGLGDYASPSVSLDGTRLAFIQGVRVFTADGWAHRTREISGLRANRVSLRPDGVRIAVFRSVKRCTDPEECEDFGLTGTIIDWAGQGRTERPSFVQSADWLAPRTLLAVSARDRSMLFTLPISGCCGRILRKDRRWSFNDVAVSPDGQTLAVSAGSSSADVPILLISRATGTVRVLTPPAAKPHQYSNPTWSPDGQWLACVKDGTTLAIVPIIAKAEVLDLAIRGGSPTWAP